jgi:hypothetical protein
MPYAYCRFSRWEFGAFRLLGPGLGNLLFPWARFVIASERDGLRPLAPTWPQLKLGPIVRREPDLRMYAGLFQRRPSELGGIRKLAALTLGRRLPEARWEAARHDANAVSARAVVEFAGLRGYFHDIADHRELVRRELLAATRTQHLNGLRFGFGRSVCVHVRLGDFTIEGGGTPMSWFVEVAASLQQALGPDTAVRIFSDGSDAQLGDLLALPTSRRLTFGSSIADLLALSAAPVIIGTAGSTFGAWGAFLGRVPSLWPPGGLTKHLWLPEDQHALEVAAGDAIPASFIDAVRSRSA